MADNKFPEDKERGKRTHAPPEDPIQTPPTAQSSTRQTVFLLALLWICWLVACISDTLLSIDRAMWTYTSMTPLQHYVYYNNWDQWLYNVRQLSPSQLRKYHASMRYLAQSLTWSQIDKIRGPQAHLLEKICIGSLALCVMLMFALSNSLQHVGDVASTFTNVLLIISLFVASYLGFSEKEAIMIVIPFTLLVASTAAIILQRAGVKDIGQQLGISERVGTWARGLSLVVFFMVNMRLYGSENEFIIIMCLWQGIGFVYSRLG